MTYVTLELLDDGDRRIAIEGFPDFTQAAAYTLARLHGGSADEYAQLRPDKHNDIREVRSMMTSADELARFYVRLGYDDSDVRAGVREQFPDCNLDEAIRGAREQVAREEEHLDRSEAETQRRIDLGEFGDHVDNDGHTTGPGYGGAPEDAR